ncbi:hypothetical protein [Nocardioides albus]|uniref:Uncharacterized protein n=1 Tax=Nocardioides albus TaxID=1841 RepID=A0A7W5F8X1_9ACTN|nr:hypothetical protein [Nocardioides albus]MBB3089605.1 hypothetical protein [Nocardioides albus]GGU30699.1 hypothetical protein GCM10007979_31840 [Nocardioides albus]
MDWIFLLMLALLVVLSLAGAIRLARLQALRRRHRRTAQPSAAYRLFAADHGWSYSSEDNVWTTQFQLLPDASPSAIHVVRGVHAGLRFVSYEHVYTTSESVDLGPGPSLTVRLPQSKHVIAFDLEHLHPWLVLTPRPTQRRQRQPAPVGGMDAFERSYEIETTRRSFTERLLSPEVRALLLAHPGPRYQLDGPWLVMVWDGRAAMEQVPERIDSLVAFLQAIPTGVIHGG